MKECENIIQKALKEKRPLLESEAQQICALHHIPTPKSGKATSAHDAILKAKEIGFPIVLKINSKVRPIVTN